MPTVDYLRIQNLHVNGISAITVFIDNGSYISSRTLIFTIISVIIKLINNKEIIQIITYPLFIINKLLLYSHGNTTLHTFYGY